MEIKTFTFLVNCNFGNKGHPDLREIWNGVGEKEKEDRIRENNRRLKVINEQTISPEEMDKIVNDYIREMTSDGSRTVVNIIENYYTTHQHNNGYDDDVYRSVTVITK